jgi:hypothetical protein
LDTKERIKINGQNKRYNQKTDAPACGKTKFRHQRKVENCMDKARDISRRKIHPNVEVENCNLYRK